MKDTWLKIKNKVMGNVDDYDLSDDYEDDYLEIDSDEEPIESKKRKITVRPFVINEFNDIKEPLDVLREGYTIVLLNIKSLKDSDIMELKRVVNKLKKTCDAISGDIAGFGDDWIVVTPSFAEIYRN
ncbi:cell division protein SepF [Candidatus Woesearchaeota archaeon]|nr:MAG: cell division protein SepF [Candidatus Woesearchaeota archaeon]